MCTEQHRSVECVCISGRHFNHLLEKYGSPVVVLNLVKKREMKRRHEALLGEEFAYQVGSISLDRICNPPVLYSGEFFCNLR